MGCDIHVYLEAKKTVNEVDQWVNVDHWQINPYFNKEDSDWDGERELEQVPVYWGRNYELFGLLAGVRDNSMNPIVDPRGLPEDVSKITRKEYEHWKSDLHTPSYLTYYELMKYYHNHKKHQELLDYFLKGIKERFQQEFYILPPETRKVELEKKFRIIFWFDN